MKLEINGREHEIASEPDTPLLWVLRDELGLVGTRFGCGIGQCGACTVLLDGSATRSCLVPVQSLEGRKVTTIEGLDGVVAGVVRAAWIEHQVPQCGYCQSGFVVATTALLRAGPNPSEADIDASLTNICRCGTYDAIRAAIHASARALARAAPAPAGGPR